MSGAYTSTVIIERTIELEVNVRVLPDEPDTYDTPGLAGDACVEDVVVHGAEAELSEEEKAEAIEKAKQQGAPDEAPDCGPPNDSYNHPF